MVLKTSYKITFLLSLIHNYIGSLQACLQRRIRKAFKTFFFELGLECLPTQGEAPFLFRNLDGLKDWLEESRRVHVCVNFPHARLVLCRFLSFSLVSIMSTGRDQTIIVTIYLFSVVLNISNVCH